MLEMRHSGELEKDNIQMTQENLKEHIKEGRSTLLPHMCQLVRISSANFQHQREFPKRCFLLLFDQQILFQKLNKSDKNKIKNLIETVKLGFSGKGLSY